MANSIISDFQKWQKQGDKFLQYLQAPETQPINYNFDAEFRRKKINQVIRQLHQRKNEIAVNLVADWTDKTEDYLRRNIPQRNGHKNRFYAVDVLKFLCDLWDLDYPEEYETYGRKLGIIKEMA